MSIGRVEDMQGLVITLSPRIVHPLLEEFGFERFHVPNDSPPNPLVVVLDEKMRLLHPRSYFRALPNVATIENPRKIDLSGTNYILKHEGPVSYFALTPGGEVLLLGKSKGNVSKTKFVRFDSCYFNPGGKDLFKEFFNPEVRVGNF